MKKSTTFGTKPYISKTLGLKQHGAVLLVSLVILLVLTIIGVSAMRNTVLEEKMVSNMRDKSLSFEAAEATLRAAEKYIKDNVVSTNAFDTDGSDGLYDKSNMKLWKTLNWDANDSIENSSFDSTYHVANPPRFIIQHIASITSSSNGLNLGNYGQNTGAGTNEIFLITARATGGSGSAPVILQTTYGKLL
jgi:type IV pilus assembly protein PilX